MQYSIVKIKLNPRLAHSFWTSQMHLEVRKLFVTHFAGAHCVRERDIISSYNFTFCERASENVNCCRGWISIHQLCPLSKSSKQISSTIQKATAVMSLEHVIKRKLKEKKENRKATLPKIMPRKENGFWGVRMALTRSTYTSWLRNKIEGKCGPPECSVTAGVTYSMRKYSKMFHT